MNRPNLNYTGRVRVAVVLVFVAGPLLASSSELPPPTGKFATGQAAYVWTDANRDEVLTEDASDKREFSVSVWYPTDVASHPDAPYLPDFESWRLKIGEQRLKESLGGAWDAVKSSKALAHVGAPLAKGRQRFPLLVLLPGLGMNTRVYSSLLTDLASHGYVIVAVDPTYEVFATTLGGGRVAGFASPGWFRPPVENIVRYERGRLLVWAADARFALERLRRQPPFDRWVDWSSVGALGHSAGARVAAHLCHTERSVQLFESVRPGSIEITLNPPGMGHGSFTDLPLLGNGPPGDHRRAMELIRRLSLAFFDRALTGTDNPALESVPSASDVEPERYVFKGPTPKQ